MELVSSPIKFMKWFVSTIFERITGLLGNIREYAKKLWHATWSIFKRILFNPITIALIVGFLFWHFGPQLLKILSSGVDGIKNKFLIPLANFAKESWDMLKKVFVASVEVGKMVFNAIEWITNPKGILASTLRFLIGTFFAIKKGIKKLLVVSGRDSVDLFCMFLAGDYIGIAVRMAGAAIVKMWHWFRTTKLMKIMLGITKTLVKFGEIYLLFWPKVAQGLYGMAKAILFKRGDKVLDALMKPFTDWWKGVKSIWVDGVDRDVVVEDPMSTIGNQ